MSRHTLHAFDLERPALQPRATLPCITDDPKREWLTGWWQGIGVGVAIGFGIAVMLVRG